jgi:hypothetical protein
MLDYILSGLQTQSFFLTLLWHLRHSNLGFSDSLSLAFFLPILHIVLPIPPTSIYPAPDVSEQYSHYVSFPGMMKVVRRNTPTCVVLRYNQN